MHKITSKISICAEREFWPASWRRLLDIYKANKINWQGALVKQEGSKNTQVNECLNRCSYISNKSWISRKSQSIC